jgi:hypothetical protein
MNHIRVVALLGAIVLTAGELFSLDYYTAQLASEHTAQAAVATLIAQR